MMAGYAAEDAEAAKNPLLAEYLKVMQNASDADYDARLARLTATRDPGARATLQAQADDHLLREAVVAPLYLNTRTWLMSPRVHGWSEDAFWSRHYHGVRMDAK